MAWFERSFTGLEYRPQVDITGQRGRRVNESHHLMVEAGTGTGKSMAYLIPAIYCVQNGQQWSTSTITINSADQLINKDIPALQKFYRLDIQRWRFKGRSNYVCPHRCRCFERRKISTLKSRDCWPSC